MIMGRPQRSLPPGKPEQLTQTPPELAKKLPPPVVHGPHTGTALRPALPCCYCADDEPYKYGECFCLCHTRGFQSKDLRVCPECGTPLEPYAEVDIGVGTLQGGPRGCPACHWIETDPALAETALPDIDLAIADDDGDEL